MGRVKYRSALAVGFVVALATVGAACGGSDDSTDTTTAAAPAASTDAAAPAASTAAAAVRQGRRHPARLEVVGPLGDRSTAPYLGDGVQGRRRRVRHPERRGRQGQDGDDRRPDDHQRRQGPDDRQPRLASRARPSRRRPPTPASRPSTTTASRSVAPPTCTSRSTTSRSASLQGEGLVKCLDRRGRRRSRQIVELNGSPTDNNATLFKQGYDAVLKPLFDAGDTPRSTTRAFPDWDNQKGGQIFEQMLTDGRRQDRRRARRQRRPRRRGHRRAAEEQPAGPGHRPGRHRVEGLQHPHRRPVHDRLQGRQDRSRRRRRGRDRAARRRDAATTDTAPSTTRATARRPLRAGRRPSPIYKDNVKDVIADGFVDRRPTSAPATSRRRAPKPASS